MKRLTSLAAVAALLFAGSALAGPGGHCGGKAKDGKLASGKSAQTAGCQPGCCAKNATGALAKVLDKLPKMTYRVGDLETPCLKTATDKAGDESKIKWVVAGQTYDCKKRASAELASLLEKHAESMMAVQCVVNGEVMHCPTMAKQAAAKNGSKVVHRLCGVDFDSKDKADAAAETIRKAVASLASAVGAKADASKSPCAGKCAPGEKRPDCAKTCSKSKAATVSAKAAGGCGSKASQAAATPKGGCCASAKGATAKAKGGCCASAKGATAKAKSGCNPQAACDRCAEAEARLAKVQEKLRVMVETASKMRAS